MSKELSEEIRQFIFQHIDSVEQLDMLVLMRLHPERWWTARLMSEELRTSVTSASNRLHILKSIGLVIENESSAFQYRPKDAQLRQLVDELDDQYKLRKHTILQLIFSTKKSAKSFANAFVISSSDKKTEGSNDG